MLRLRTAQGIEEWEYRSAYFMDFAPLETRLRQFQAQGWAEQAGGRVAADAQGLLVSNQLIGDLLERQEESSLDQLLPRPGPAFRQPGWSLCGFCLRIGKMFPAFGPILHTFHANVILFAFWI